MSLFSSIQLANNGLRAQQIGLQVVGQNIANANTPGYSREEVVLVPAPTQRIGGLLLGLGVEVQGVVQRIDRFLEERLRSATSDRTSSEAQSETYTQLESVINELTENDLSTSLNSFISSVSDILNQPESASVRNLAALRAKTFASDVSRLAQRVEKLRTDANDQVAAMGADINRLLDDIRQLNVQISTAEGGEASTSDAVGLRDRRNLALTELAKLIDIRVEEQKSSAANVFHGGDFLIFEGTVRRVEVVYENDRGLEAADIQIENTEAPLSNGAGKLAGLIKARDDVLGTFQERLDNYARTATFEFNRLFSSGQGLKGYQSLASQYAVTDDEAALDEAGLTYTPTTGAFKVLVLNKQTGLTQTTEISVDLNGLDNNDTTLESLAAEINAVDGISATVDSSGFLQLAADSKNIEFAFAEDNSSTLAALGINTLFTGTSARTMGVHQAVLNDPLLFAVSQKGVGRDTLNGVALAGFMDRRLESVSGVTIADLYDQMAGEVTQGASLTKAVTEGFETFEETLRGQQLATSGVSLDEEAVRMITYQRAYQATARYIATLSELLDLLVNL